MGVTLRQAWAICAVLDELDEERSEQDTARATILAGRERLPFTAAEAARP